MKGFWQRREAHFVAKLVKSFGRLGDAAESLNAFHYTKACFLHLKSCTDVGVSGS